MGGRKVALVSILKHENTSLEILLSGDFENEVYNFQQAMRVVTLVAFGMEAEENSNLIRNLRFWSAEVRDTSFLNRLGATLPHFNSTMDTLFPKDLSSLTI